MRIRIHIFALATACVLAAPAAHAFSMQSKDTTDPYGLPKFDLEEQSRNFRTGGVDASSSNKKPFEWPLGNGTFHFDVHQGPASDFLTPGLGSTFGSGLGPQPRNSREDFNRVVTPENLR